MSTAIVNSEAPLYKALKSRWAEQNLSYIGGRVWTDWAITQNTLETTTGQAKTGAECTYVQRQFYATNPVSVRPPIQKVQNSAQNSSGQASLDVGSDYLNSVLNNNADGEGISWYNWLIGGPLANMALNGVVWLCMKLPALPEGIERPSQADLDNGTIAPPKFVFLNAESVVNWIEKEGDIKNGQFSKVLYKTAILVPNPKSGFLEEEMATVLYGEDLIITYNKEGKELFREVNTLGFVPITRSDIGHSLVGEGVEFSKLAVELASLAAQNMRDGYFNLLVLKGTTLEKNQTLSSGTAFAIATDSDIMFVSPDTAPESETREKVKALQDQLDTTVQQAHSNFSKSGSTLGSGVAYKEQGSLQAASVKFMMDTLLEKFKVVIHYAQKGLGMVEEILMVMPDDYSFESEESKIDQALDLETLAATAASPESKKAINAKKISKLFNDDEQRKELIEADNAAIDAGAQIDAIPEVSLDEV